MTAIEWLRNATDRPAALNLKDAQLICADGTRLTVLDARLKRARNIRQDRAFIEGELCLGSALPGAVVRLTGTTAAFGQLEYHAVNLRTLELKGRSGWFWLYGFSGELPHGSHDSGVPSRRASQVLSPLERGLGAADAAPRQAARAVAMNERATRGVRWPWAGR